MAGWETQARDDHGRFASGGGGGGGEEAPWQSRTNIDTPEGQQVFAYTTGAAGEVNVPLRDPNGVGMTGDVEEKVMLMDTAIEFAQPSTEDQTLYRVSLDRSEMEIPGVPEMEPPPDYMSMEPGEVVLDPGYMSTSTDPAWVAQMESGLSPPSGDLQVVEIHAPAGTQALDVNSTLGPFSTYAHQSEVILPRASSLEITSQHSGRVQAVLK